MPTPTKAEIEAQAVKAFTPPNITEQGKLVKLLGGDLAKAAEIAAEYGGEIGTLKAAEPEPDKTGKSNPWSDNFEGTPAQKQAEQDRILRTRGTAMATALAKAAGYSVLGYKLKR
jgi:hypothetical protein